MRYLSTWEHLRPYGIVVLTAEACGLSYRLLCDVTAAGKKLLEKVFDVPSLTLHPNWNRGDPADPPVGSIMLTREMFEAVAVFALLEVGCTEVWRLHSGCLAGIEPTDTAEDIESLTELHPEYSRRFRYAGTAGDRNVHEMSGRIR